VSRFPSFACGKNRLRSTALLELLSGCASRQHVIVSLPFFCLRQKPAALDSFIYQ
jgi:hypothetical protein